MKISYLTADDGRSTAYLDDQYASTPQGLAVPAEDKHSGRSLLVFPLADDWIEVAPEDMQSSVTPDTK